MKTNIFGVNIYDLGEKALKSYLRSISRIANDRLLRIEKSGKDSWAYKQAMNSLSSQKRNRFRYGFSKSEDMIREIQRVETFINMPSSTLSGLRETKKRSWNSLVSKYEEKYGEGSVMRSGLTPRKFYSFINSKMGQDMIQDYGSGNVFDDIFEATIKYKMKLEKVVEEYNEFNRLNVPFEAVELRRRKVIGKLEDYNILKKLGLEDYKLYREVGKDKFEMLRGRIF